MSGFDKLLKKVSAEEFRTFIHKYARNDQDFKVAFEIYFSSKDDNPDLDKKYIKLVRRIISKYSDRGYVDYSSSFAMSTEIDSLLEIGFELANKNNFRDGFMIARTALRELLDILTYYDDSGGCIGGSVSYTIQLMDVIANAEKAASELRDEIFLFVENELQNRAYFDYGDFGYDLFSIYRCLAAKLGKKEAYLTFLEKQLSQLSAAPYSDYQKEFLIKQKIKFFREINESDEARRLTEQHLNIVELRMDEVNQALMLNDMEQAKKLIGEGINIAKDKEHPGTVAQWEKELLRIAELENDVPTIRQYAKHFAFDRGFDKEAYNKWKSTYRPDEWTEVINHYIKEKSDKITDKHAKINKAWGYRTSLIAALAPIFIAEQYWDRLLALMQKENDLNTLLTYHKHLKNRYPRELLELYLPALEKEGDRVSNRKEYATLVSNMKKVIKDIPQGEESIKSLAQKLKKKYARRPAMLDELDKLY